MLDWTAAKSLWGEQTYGERAQGVGEDRTHLFVADETPLLANAEKGYEKEQMDTSGEPPGKEEAGNRKYVILNSKGAGNGSFRAVAASEELKQLEGRGMRVTLLGQARYFDGKRNKHQCEECGTHCGDAATLRGHKAYFKNKGCDLAEISPRYTKLCLVVFAISPIYAKSDLI